MNGIKAPDMHATYRLLTLDPSGEPPVRLENSCCMIEPESEWRLRGEHLNRGDLRRLLRQVTHEGYDDVSMYVEREDDPYGRTGRNRQ